MTPTIGRIVHVETPDGHVAAVVTKVWSETTVNVTLFPDNFTPDLPRMTSVPYGTDVGSWHWPEIVGA